MIKSIHKIEIVDISELSEIRIIDESHVSIPDALPLTDIMIHGLAECVANTVKEDGLLLMEVELQFQTYEKIDSQALAYILHSVDGNRYLLGNYNRPFPTMTRTENMPSDVTKTSSFVYKVIWKGVSQPSAII